MLHDNTYAKKDVSYLNSFANSASELHGSIHHKSPGNVHPHMVRQIRVQMKSRDTGHKKQAHINLMAKIKEQLAFDIISV